MQFQWIKTGRSNVVKLGGELAPNSDNFCYLESISQSNSGIGDINHKTDNVEGNFSERNVADSIVVKFGEDKVPKSDHFHYLGPIS